MQADLLDKCGKCKITIQNMIRAVVTRWLTQGTVLQRALELRPALDALCDDSNWNPIRNRKKAIQKFKLTDEQWEFLEQLEPMLIVRIWSFCVCLALIDAIFRCLLWPPNGCPSPRSH